jgi:hypothetical protein
MPPQLSFVRRWHTYFLDLGERILFTSGSRDSEQISMIRQGFYELEADDKDEACRIIRNGVMGMEVSLPVPN